MTLRDIKALLKLMEGTDVTEIEWEGEGGRLAVRRGSVAPHVQLPAAVVAPTPVAVKSKGEGEALPSGHLVKSPLVGTFYRSPAPDAAPFTDVGKRVQKGQVICIIEAMKLMNEITADASGTVQRVLVENGHPVEFGQALFAIDPA